MLNQQDACGVTSDTFSISSTCQRKTKFHAFPPNVETNYPILNSFLTSVALWTAIPTEIKTAQDYVCYSKCIVQLALNHLRAPEQSEICQRWVKSWRCQSEPAELYNDWHKHHLSGSLDSSCLTHAFSLQGALLILIWWGPRLMEASIQQVSIAVYFWFLVSYFILRVWRHTFIFYILQVKIYVWSKH